MDKQQQKQTKNQTAAKRDEISKYLKMQKTYSIEYQIVKQLIKMVQNAQQENNYQNFKILYQGLSKQMKNTMVFKLLNYKIWNNQNFPVEIREKTQFFELVSEWIVIFELKVSDLTDMKKQLEFLIQFFKKNTSNIFQRIVLIDQIHQDLIQLLGKQFWGIKDSQLKQSQIKSNQEQEDAKMATKEEAAYLLKFLGILVQYYAFYQNDKKCQWYNSELYMLRDKSEHYKQFVSRSIEYMLSVNSKQNSPENYLQKHQQMELTRIALIFLQRPDLAAKSSVNLLKLLMLRTSKIVRYAMVVDYVRLYDYLEKSNQYQIIQELENMIYFRQLIIGHSQIEEAQLTTSQLIKELEVINIAARTRQRVLMSHQPQFGLLSILQLQVLIQGGDISIAIYHIQNGKQVEYWKQSRTEDRRVDLMLKEHGLYIIEFDNTFSWIKSKRLSYKVEQFCLGLD